MKQTILITILALFTILTIAQASATVVQQNNFYYGIIENNGSLTTTTTSVTDVSAIGFICSNADCSATSGALWNGAILNSGNESRLDLIYPTLLQDNGYGIFFYKSGYIPYEVKATWAGSGEASAEKIYLTRKQSCWTNISNLQASYADGKLTVTANVNSPFGNAGHLNYTPNSLVSEYSADVQIKLNITGANNYETTQTVNLKFSETKLVNFQFQTGSGNYSITLTTNCADAKCLNSQERTSTINYSVAGSVPNPGNNDGSHGTSPNDKKKQEKKVINSEEVEEVDEYAEEITVDSSASDSIDANKNIALNSSEEKANFSWILYLLGILCIIVLVLIIFLLRK